MTKIVNLLSKPQKGFGLLEVLITVVILAIGLLGLAALQGVSLKNNTSAYHRSQANILVSDIVDRMRANSNLITNYRSGFMAPTIAVRQAPCLAAGCSAAQMAQHDLYEWNALITSVLPGAVGNISFADPLYTVSITWDDDRDGNNANNPNFQVSFQP